jgi:hypothetical protein
MAIEVRESKIAGQGIFTTDFIAKHSVILQVKFLREITEEKPIDPKKGEQLDHCYWLPDSRQMLVAEPECYTNSSCLPNAFLYSVNRKCYLLAIRDIQNDEEITLNYSLLIAEGDDLECTCGAPSCRGNHKLGFFSMPQEEQLRYLPYLDPWFAQVHADRIEQLLKPQKPGTGINF